jgi:predicted alpha-1,2-mannosidase
MRAFHPLMTIVDPKLNSDFIGSLLRKYREGGILPMWELAANYTGTMIGYNAVPVIVDAYMKGDRSFDAVEALKACRRSAEYDTKGIASTKYVLENGLMPVSKYYKNSIGYIPCDKENENVAKGLEYAYDDWCIARLAQNLNDTIVERRYDKLAKNYANYFDPSVGFMRGKDSAGKWRVPFAPNTSTHREDDYCEGTSWQWTWFVPHDVEGLKKLMGGNKAFVTKLDSLFSVNTPMEGDKISADISGLIGQYAHGNEPSHHIIHLYNYANQPWKTQTLVDSVLYGQYRNAPDGLSGNEDCGQMSAWYILNAMGFYQVCPGNPTYSIGRPLFDRVVIPLSNGKSFQVDVKNASRTNKYIQSVKLNNRKLTIPFFNHSDIMNGGKIEFVMTNKPTKWGSD